MPDNPLLPENLLWLECLIRILIAIFLGFTIGVERQLRLKVAGIRTHAVVSAGACLFVIVSIFGFRGADAARVAAQVVSGIGFIGAGMILHRQNAVHGLTSAAGIWLTAAIGMAVGSGLYIVSLGATIIIILVQMFLHLPLRLLKEKHYTEVSITFSGSDNENLNKIKTLFAIEKFTDFKAERKEEDIIINAVIHTKKQVDDEFIRCTIQENSFILSIEQAVSDR